ncbi:imelysin family protein [Celeribacter sp.]|uniref:imelysin family protein n=1 Tax=Celeribacter sp. TaxID=1890673 RepID=UPI003A93D63F
MSYLSNFMFCVTLGLAPVMGLPSAALAQETGTQDTQEAAQSAAVARVVADYLPPALDGFVTASEALERAVAQECAGPATQAAFHDAFDAWLAVQPLTLAGFDHGTTGTAISFWPDKKGAIPRTLAGLIADEDPVIADAAAFAEVSIAARGLFAMEMLLFDPQFAPLEAGSYACDLLDAQARDLMRMAQEMRAIWFDAGGYADALTEAGGPNATLFFSPREAAQALYTVLTATLTHDRDQRLGRPMGTFERPRPIRAEARRSERAAANLTGSLAAMERLTAALSDGAAVETKAALDRAIAQIEALDDADFSDADDLGQRFEMEVAQQSISTAMHNAANEIGTRLGVSAGFNAGDGD